MTPTRIAFFDVDGTLTTGTTLFRFLRHYLAAQGHPPQEYERRRGVLKAMTESGTPRERTNLAYVENYRGADLDTVNGLAREWFAAELRQGGFLNPRALAALRRHRRAGDLTVLVSGSIPACLDPISDYLGTDETHCTVPEVVDGRYTGRVTGPPMIGATKADTLRAAAGTHGIPLDRCTAYGDHDSDLPMLRAAGSAAVVGGDGRLRALARSYGWGLLPGAPLPPPVPLPGPARAGTPVPG